MAGLWSKIFRRSKNPTKEDGEPSEKPPQQSSPKPPRIRWKWRWLGIPVFVGTATVAVVEGVVYGLRVNHYPYHGKLNYTLVETYQGANFFDKFNYFNDHDTSQGFVYYVNRQYAMAQNLTYASAHSAVLRVMANDPAAAAGTGRKSVRIESKKQYNDGLFIFDIIHTPYGCGTWPSLWTTDPAHWPDHGEIDVVEATNRATDGNQMTLHTFSDVKIPCTMKNVHRKETGKILLKDCVNTTLNNAGCAVLGPHDTYGETFNADGGGIYAMELRSAGIRIWFFPRSSIPPDINTNNGTSSSSSSPDPTSWGTPLADFPKTKCDIDRHFRNQSIVANINLCGPWAGQAEKFGKQCPPGMRCEEWVSNEDGAFESAYWEFGGFWVYRREGGS